MLKSLVLDLLNVYIDGWGGWLSIPLQKPDFSKVYITMNVMH